MFVDAFFTILLLIIILGLLVFVHEAGHFIAARLIGVEVEEFAFGFGPKVFMYKYHDTLYCINLLPLGGYVKIIGDEDPSSFTQKQEAIYSEEEISKIDLKLSSIDAKFGSILSRVDKVKKSDLTKKEKTELLKYLYGHVLVNDKDYFGNKNSLQKLFVFVAGVIMNMILASVIFSGFLAVNNYKTDLAYIADYPFIGTEENVYERPLILHIYSEELIQEGLEPIEEDSGIVLMAINGQQIENEDEFKSIWNQIEGQSVEVEYVRFGVGKIQTKQLILNHPGYDINIEPDLSQRIAFVEVLQDTPASDAGLRAKDILLSIDSVPVTYENVDDFVDYLELNEQNVVDFEVLGEDGQIRDVIVSLGQKDGSTPILGARFSLNNIITVQQYHLDYSDKKVFAGVSHSINLLGYNPVALWQILKLSFETHDISIASETVSSVWGVGENHIARMVSNNDYMNIINTVGYISVVLAFMNILPIPLLDGGQVLFLLIEKIKGSPIKPSTQEKIAQVSFVFLVGFSVLILLKDIWGGFVGDFVRGIL